MEVMSREQWEQHFLLSSLQGEVIHFAGKTMAIEPNSHESTQIVILGILNASKSQQMLPFLIRSVLLHRRSLAFFEIQQSLKIPTQSQTGHT